MSRKLWKKKSVRFSDKKHSIKGIISLIIGVISIFTLFLLFYESAKEGGNGDVTLGFIGAIIFILSIVGTVLGYQGSKEKDIHYYVPIIGLIMNGLIFLSLFLLYIVGILAY